MSIAVVMKTLVIITKGTENHVNKIPGRISIPRLRKITSCRSEHIPKTHSIKTKCSKYISSIDNCSIMSFLFRDLGGDLVIR